MTDPDQNAPVPPAGYTAEELERDNPHNAWMNDMSLETSEADARPCAYREVEQMVIDGRIKIHRLTAQEIASEFAYIGTRTNAASDWPDDLTTSAERKAYQRGVADARRVDRASVQLECLVDFVARVTHWTEGGATRHDAILALKQLGVWK